jgi:hypothetical protein
MGVAYPGVESVDDVFILEALVEVFKLLLGGMHHGGGGGEV